MTNATKKITKKTYYNTLAAILDYAEAQGVIIDAEGVTYEGMHNFIAHEIELLDNKAAAAAKRAADKRQAGDELREKVFSVLSTENYMTINEIVAALGNPDYSAQMITARLTQLASSEVGRVEKNTVTVPASTEGGKTRKVSGYRAI